MPTRTMRMLGVNEAAAYLGVSVRTMRRLGAMSIPRYQVSPRRVAYCEADLVAYLESVQVSPISLNSSRRSGESLRTSVAQANAQEYWDRMLNPVSNKHGSRRKR